MATFTDHACKAGCGAAVDTPGELCPACRRAAAGSQLDMFDSHAQPDLFGTRDNGGDDAAPKESQCSRSK